MPTSGRLPLLPFLGEAVAPVGGLGGPAIVPYVIARPYFRHAPPVPTSPLVQARPYFRRTVTIPPIVGGIVTVTSITSSGVLVTASGASGGTTPYHYQFQRAPDVAGSPGTYVNLGANQLSTGYSDSVLTPGTSYWWRVVITDSAGTPATMTSPGVKATTTAVLVSGTVTMSGVTSTAATATVAATSGGTAPYHYQFQRAPDVAGSPGTFANIGSSQLGTTYADSGLTVSTPYWWRVVVTDSASTPDVVTSASVKATTTAVLVSGTVTMSAVASSVATATVTSTAGGTTPYHYQFQRAPDVAGSPGTYANIGSSQLGTSYGDSGLTGATAYWWRVVVTDSAGTPAVVTSPGVSATTTAVLAAGTVAMSAVTSLTATVTATGPSGGTLPYHYQFQRASDVAGSPGIYVNIGSNQLGASYGDSGLASSSPYWWRVVVSDSAGSPAVATSAGVTATTLVPLLPGTVSAGSLSSSGATITANGPSGGVTPYHYQFQRAPDVAGSPGTYANIGSSQLGTGYVDSGLTTSTPYWWRVVVTDSASSPTTVTSAGVSATTTPPALVSGTVTMSAVTSTAATATVTSTSGGVSPYHYQFQRAPDVAGSPGTFANIGSSQLGTSYGDSGLTTTTAYWWRVVITDSAGTPVTVTSASVSATTTPTTLVSGTVAMSAVTSSAATATVTSTTGGTTPYHYQFQRAPDVGGVAGTYANTGSSQLGIGYVDSGLTAATAYWWRVVVTDSAGSPATVTSAGVSATTTPALVSGTVAISGVTTTTATATVASTSGGTAPYHYQFQRAPDVAGSPGTYANTGSSQLGTGYADSGLTPATAYWWRVVTTDSAGSPATVTSAGVSATTTAVLISGTVAISGVTSSTATATVTATSGGVAPYHYQFQRAPDVAGSPGTYANTGSSQLGTGYADSGLTPGTTYWWRVVVTDSAGSPATATSSGVLATTVSTLISGTMTISGMTPTTATMTVASTSGGTAPYLYQFQRALDVSGSPGTYVNIGPNQPGASYTDSGLTPGTAYWWRVVVTDSAGIPITATSGGVGSTTTAAFRLDPLPFYRGKLTAPGTLVPGTVVAVGLTSSSASVTTTAATGGVAPYHYQFQRAPNVGGLPGTYANTGASQLTLTYTDSGLTPGTVYWWRVVVTDSAGTPATAISGSVTGTTAPVFYFNPLPFYRGKLTAPPLPPSAFRLNPLPFYRGKLTVSPLVAGTVAMGAVTSATATATASGTTGGIAPYHYQFQRAPDVSGSPGTYANLGSSQLGTSYDDSGLAATTPYWWRVIVTDSAGTPITVTSAGVTATTGAPPLVAGTVAMGAVTSTMATATASGTTGGIAPYHYQFQRAPDVSGSPGTYANLGASQLSTTYSDSALTATTPYWWRVVVTDSAGTPITVTSAGVTATTGAPPLVAGTVVMGAVTSSTATATAFGTTGGIVPYHYQFQRAPDVAGSPGIYADIGSSQLGTSYGDSGLTTTTPYWWRVVVTDSAGVPAVDISAGVTATTSPASLAAGTIAMSSVTSASAMATVTSTTGGTAPYHYQFQRAPDVSGSAGTYANIGSSQIGTSYGDSGLASSTPYWWRVVVTDSAGSPAVVISASVTATTTAALVSGTVSVGALTAATATVTTTSATGGTIPYHYQFQRAPDVFGSAGTYADIGFSQLGTSYGDSGLAESTAYWWRVVVTDSAGSPAVDTSAGIMATTGTPALAAGTVAMSSVTSGTATVTASGTTGGTLPYHYQFQRALDVFGSAGTYLNIGSSQLGTSYGDSGLAESTAYWWRAIVTDSASTPDTVALAGVTATTGTSALIAGTVAMSGVTSSVATVTASGTTGGTVPYHYQFQRALDVSGSPDTYTDIGVSQLGTSYADSGLVDGTVYWWRVVITDSAVTPAVVTSAGVTATAVDTLLKNLLACIRAQFNADAAMMAALPGGYRFGRNTRRVFPFATAFLVSRVPEYTTEDEYWDWNMIQISVFGEDADTVNDIGEDLDRLFMPRKGHAKYVFRNGYEMERFPGDRRLTVDPEKAPSNKQVFHYIYEINFLVGRSLAAIPG